MGLGLVESIAIQLARDFVSTGDSVSFASLKLSTWGVCLLACLRVRLRV